MTTITTDEKDVSGTSFSPFLYSSFLFYLLYTSRDSSVAVVTVCGPDDPGSTLIMDRMILNLVETCGMATGGGFPLG
jgi:hypothetical protein